MKKQQKAYLFALAAVLLWSTVATAFKFALKEVHFLILLFWSSFISFLALSTILFFSKSKLKIKYLDKKECLKNLLAGLLNPFLYYLVLFKAYSVLPAQEAMTLNYTWPVMLILLSWPFLGQKITAKGWIGITLCLAGIITISTHGDVLSFRFSNPVGDLLALGSSLVWALFWIWNIKSKTDDLIKLWLNFITGSIASFIVLCIVPIPGIMNTNAIIPLIYIGLFEMSITFFLWLLALRNSKSTDKVSLLIFISPFLSLIFISLILQERLLPSTVPGIILIIIGISFRNISFSKKKINS